MTPRCTDFVSKGHPLSFLHSCTFPYFTPIEMLTFNVLRSKLASVFSLLCNKASMNFRLLQKLKIKNFIISFIGEIAAVTGHENARFSHPGKGTRFRYYTRNTLIYPKCWRKVKLWIYWLQQLRNFYLTDMSRSFAVNIFSVYQRLRSYK